MKHPRHYETPEAFDLSSIYHSTRLEGTIWGRLSPNFNHRWTSSLMKKTPAPSLKDGFHPVQVIIAQRNLRCLCCEQISLYFLSRLIGNSPIGPLVLNKAANASTVSFLDPIRLLERRHFFKKGLSAHAINCADGVFCLGWKRVKANAIGPS